MYRKLVRWFHQRRAERLAGYLADYVHQGERVLDFGGGAMLVAEALQRRTGAEIEGVDVIDINMTEMKLTVFDGEHLPYKAGEFDVVMVVLVLHHVEKQEEVLRECVRVAKERLLVMEDVYRNRLELLVLKALDWLGNRLTTGEMVIPFKFRTEQEWVKVFESLGLRVREVRPIRPVMMRPTRHRLFVLEK